MTDSRRLFPLQSSSLSTRGWSLRKNPNASSEASRPESCVPTSKQLVNRSERNDEICRLYGQGVKQAALALQFGISQPMVCKILGAWKCP